MKTTLICLLMLAACIGKAQIIRQMSILPFVHEVGRTTAVQDTFAEAWSLWWNNADMLIQSNQRAMGQTALQEYSFQQYGYSTVSGALDQLLVKRHRLTIDELLIRCRHCDPPLIFREAYDTIMAALSEVDGLIKAEGSYLLSGSATDLTAMQAHRTQAAIYLSDSRDAFWMAVKTTK